MITGLLKVYYKLIKRDSGIIYFKNNHQIGGESLIEVRDNIITCKQAGTYTISTNGENMKFRVDTK